MTILELARPHLGIAVDRQTCTAQNEKGATVSRGDVVLFDVGAIGDVGGAVKGDSADPNDNDYFFGIIRDTPDKSTGSAAEDAVNQLIAYGIYGIALADILDGESGELLVQGYVEANILVDEGGISGAGTVGTLVGATEATTLNHDVMHGTADCTAGTKVLAIALEVPADIIVEELMFVLFDGIYGFGVMA